MLVEQILCLHRFAPWCDWPRAHKCHGVLDSLPTTRLEFRRITIAHGSFGELILVQDLWLSTGNQRHIQFIIDEGEFARGQIGWASDIHIQFDKRAIAIEPLEQVIQSNQ